MPHKNRSSQPVEELAPVETEYVEETLEECTCPTEQDREQVIEVDGGAVIEEPPDTDN